MVSTYTQTRQSIPYIVSGEFFEGGNAEAENQYYSESIQNSKLFERLQNGGFRIGFYEVEATAGDCDRLFSFDNIRRETISKVDVKAYVKANVKS